MTLFLPLAIGSISQSSSSLEITITCETSVDGNGNGCDGDVGGCENPFCLKVAACYIM